MDDASHYPGVGKYHRIDDIENGEDREEYHIRNTERQEQETEEQSISLLLLFTKCLFKLQSINLEAAFELAMSLSKERYDFVKKLAPMGK